ncbi:MAG: Mur ligase family protein [Alphaproteobacteria bacterium]|nr:Mur ligase family protein [Alphaproteobacteria bacterium]
MTLNQNAQYFFCGIGGSGMLPLALILRGKGYTVEGSDRALDQGRLGPKFEFLRSRGITLHNQDGSGLTRRQQVLVTSAAVEDTVPDVQAARRLELPILRRAELLADIFNASPQNIAVGGTSGKSTTTGMIGWILHAVGHKPTIMNGAVMKNFTSPDNPFASAIVDAGDIFVSEVDESDGSIALYQPRIAVVTNISLDHKPMAELRTLFGDFTGKAQTPVLNLDNDETKLLAEQSSGALTFSLTNLRAGLFAGRVQPLRDGISFEVSERQTGQSFQTKIQVPGVHNVSNALAALCAVRAAGVPLAQAIDALATFTGIKRRFEVVGTANGVTVIDDFAHNPDKIAATFKTLQLFPGRLIVMFQPHGFGPLKLMREELVACFAQGLADDDVLIMPDPAYFGGTTTRSTGSEDIVRGVSDAGRTAFYFEHRQDCTGKIVELARAGDRVIVMGARDDTLSDFARSLLEQLRLA